MPSTIPSALLAVCLLALTASAQDAGRRIYQANCARCHGAEGLGDGPTKVFPPPRNFRAGGFSFGNTEAAIFRTVSQGIPGTAMTAFSASLNEQDRHLVASYIVTLVPEKARHAPRAARVVITDRARVVRGYIPSRVAHKDNWPRGLACGLPGGFTLLFRTDDLRLLEVRRGPFLERSDWRGRGGTPLRVLGRDFVVFDHGNPQAPFELVGPLGSQPLQCVLQATVQAGAHTQLEYLLRQDGRDLCLVSEEHQVAPARGATGILRRITIGPVAQSLRLTWQACPSLAGASWVAGQSARFQHRGSLLVAEVEEFPLWTLARLPHGENLAVQVTAPEETGLLQGPGVKLLIELERGQKIVLDTAIMRVPSWTADLRLTLESDLEYAW